MELSRIFSEINGDFSRKSQNFLTLVYCAPADGVSFGIGLQYTAPQLSAQCSKSETDAKVSKTQRWDYRTQKSFKIGSAV